jgi:hypothetical protein
MIIIREISNMKIYKNYINVFLFYLIMLKLYPFLFFVAMAETWEKTLCKSYIRSFYTLASR